MDINKNAIFIQNNTPKRKNIEFIEKKIIIIKNEIKVLRNNNSASNKLFQEKLSRNNNKINNYINIIFKKDQNHSNTINKGLFSKNNKKDSLNEIILNSYTQEKICKKFFI